MPHIMPLKWTNLMMMSSLIMILLKSMMFFNKTYSMKLNPETNLINKKTNWKW